MGIIRKRDLREEEPPMLSLVELLEQAVSLGASDLHIVANVSPTVRIDGKIHFLNLPVLTPDASKGLITSMLDEQQQDRLRVRKNLEFSLQDAAFGRCRASLYFQRGNLEGAFRLVPTSLPSLEELGLPGVV